MGMFDYVRYKCNCPKCGHTLTDFQSKSGPRILEMLDPNDVSNFYSNCPNCDIRVEFVEESPEIKNFKCLPIDGVNDRDLPVYLPKEEGVLDSLENEHFDCQCDNLSHLVRFTYDPVDNMIIGSMMMNHYLPWYKRFSLAVRYLLGLQINETHWDCWIMNNDDRKRLMALLCKVK